MKYFVSVLLVIFLSGCDFDSLVPGAQQKFVDQGFKTAIALVELHKIRNGNYPESLAEIEYVGDWDPIYRQFVTYKRSESGYVLNVKSIDTAKLQYPEGFWKGLGIVSTNVGGFRKQNAKDGLKNEQLNNE